MLLCSVISGVVPKKWRQWQDYGSMAGPPGCKECPNVVEVGVLGLKQELAEELAAAWVVACIHVHHHPLPHTRADAMEAGPLSTSHSQYLVAAPLGARTHDGAGGVLEAGGDAQEAGAAQTSTLDL